MRSRDRLIAGVFWSVIVNITNAIYGFIAVPILISYYGKDNYGLIALATSINGYMTLLDMGLSSTNVRFFSNWLANEDTKKVNNLFQTCTAFYFFIGIINAILLFIVYLFADSIFNLDANQVVVIKHMLLVLLMIAIINWYTSCYNQLISAMENVAWVQKRTLLAKLLMICVLISTIKLKLGIVSFFFLIQVIPIILLPLTINKILKDAPYVSFWPRVDIPTLKEILPYTLNIFSFGIFQFSFYNLRPIFLGMQGSPSDITEYQIMNSMTGIVVSLSSVFLSALLPASSRIVSSKDEKNYNRIAYQGTKFITICLCFTSLGMLTISSDLLSIYVGDSFSHIIPWLNLWLLLLLGNHNQCISSLILAGSDVKAISRVSIISSCLGLMSCWFTISHYGAGGCVIGLLVYTAIQILFYWIYYWPKKMQINSRKVVFHSFLPFVLAAYLLSIVLRYIPHSENHWFNIFLFGSIFVIIYAVFCWGILIKDDKNFILDIIKKI